MSKSKTMRYYHNLNGKVHPYWMFMFIVAAALCVFVPAALISALLG